MDEQKLEKREDGIYVVGFNTIGSLKIPSANKLSEEQVAQGRAEFSKKAAEVARLERNKEELESSLSSLEVEIAAAENEVAEFNGVFDEPDVPEEETVEETPEDSPSEEVPAEESAEAPEE